MKNTQISVFRDLFKSTDVPFIIPLEKSLERIKKGKSKDLIDKIRNGNKDLKKKLPSILFAGEFRERKGKGLVKHSGLMVVDFDKYPDKDTMLSHLGQLKRNKHFVCLFISPSGNGIKGVVRVPLLTQITHPKYFKAFQQHFKFDYFDIANSNVDRVCFESFDPNIYINYDAEIFEADIVEDSFVFSEKVPVLPIQGEDSLITKIMRFNWKKSFVEGERNAYIFDISGAFCEYGISESTAIGYITTNITNGEFSEKETITTIKSAYKKREFDSKYFEDYSRIERIKSDLKNGREVVVKKHAITDEIYDTIKDEKEYEDFWYYQKDKVKIDMLKYKLFLERNGFKKHFPSDSTSPDLVRVQNNKVTHTSKDIIKDFVLEYLLTMGDTDVWKYCVNYNILFSEQHLTMLESIDLYMLNDTKEKSYIAYRNGVLEITKDKITMNDFIDMDGYIWDNHIIDRDFEVLEDYQNNYQKFINNISDNNPTAIECVIGYLLSTYKNKMNNKAIILNDEVISENPEGGTGKGLFVQGLKQIRSVSILDGKAHDDKKSFPYQTVREDTNILVFDDVKKNFSFEHKFSLVTEGMTLERKNKDAVKLPVEKSPKIVISTNYAIKGEGNSHERRRHEVEISQYYTNRLTPQDEFKEQLFDDWDDYTYLRFDNYMVRCIQTYLQLGLVKQQAKNLKLRKFVAETSMEFYEWVSDRENMPFNCRNEKQLYFNSFTTEYKDFARWLTRKRFNIWIKKYCNYIDADFEDEYSNGIRWFKIIKVEDASKKLDHVPF